MDAISQSSSTSGYHVFGLVRGLRRLASACTKRQASTRRPRAHRRRSRRMGAGRSLETGDFMEP